MIRRRRRPGMIFTMRQRDQWKGQGNTTVGTDGTTIGTGLAVCD